MVPVEWVERAGLAAGVGHGLAPARWIPQARESARQIDAGSEPGSADLSLKSAALAEGKAAELETNSALPSASVLGNLVGRRFRTIVYWKCWAAGAWGWSTKLRTSSWAGRWP